VTRTKISSASSMALNTLMQLLKSSCGCQQGRSMISLSEGLPICLGLSTSLRCHQRLGFTFGVLKLDEMWFMYAPGAKAHPPKVLNFRPELNTLHRLLRATLAPRIGDSFACPQYGRNLI
jgi:hypothetical protein